MATNPTQIIAFPESEITLVDAFVRGLPSEGTRRVYRRAIAAFNDFLGEGDLLAATRRDIEAWRACQEEAGLAPSTIATRLTALRGLYGILFDEEAIARDPAGRARLPKVPAESPRQGGAAAEVRAMIRVCDPETAIGMRDRTMLVTLSVQGWRISELLGLRVEDLGHKVATVTGKGGKVCRVPLAAATWAALMAWMDLASITHGPMIVPVLKGGRIRLGKVMSEQAADRRLKRIAKVAGVKRNFHAHLFRHGCATTALDAGVPLRDVQDHLRHADPRTTRRNDSHRRSLNNPTPHLLASKMLGG